MDEKFWKKTEKLLNKIIEEVDENGKLPLEAYKRIFPKSYKRLLHLQRLREKIYKKYWEKIKDRPKYKDPDWYKR